MPIDGSPSITPSHVTTTLAAPTTSLHHSSSEPDMTRKDKALADDSKLLNVTQRNKRKCTESRLDPDHQVSIYMAEIKAMFQDFKDEHNKKIELIYAGMEEIKLQTSQIQSSVTFLTQDYDSLKSKIDLLENQLDEERKSKALSLQQFEEKIERLECGARSSCVEIKNIPVIKQESKENLLSTVIKVATVMNVSLQPHEVKDIYRIGTKDKDNRTILVDFSTNLLKEKFIEKYKKFNKGNNKLSTEHLKISQPVKPIFISENLSPRMKRLFFLARDFANTNNFSYCWIKNGKIYLREKVGAPHILIKTEMDFPRTTVSK